MLDPVRPIEFAKIEAAPFMLEQYATVSKILMIPSYFP